MLGIHQADLCERAGIRRDTMTALEEGRTAPNRSTVRRIDNAFMSIVEERALKEIERRSIQKQLEKANKPPVDVRLEFADRLKGKFK